MSDEGKPKSKRGGRRPGAGRKKKPHIPLAEIEALRHAPAPDSIEAVAGADAQRVIDKLVRTMLYATADAARVKAAKQILDRGYGKPSVEAGGDPTLPFLGTKPARQAHDLITPLARQWALVAIETLTRIAQYSESSTASVAACVALLDRAAGTPSTAKVPDVLDDLRRLGKKEQADRAAAAANVGRYATPDPPKKKPGSEGDDGTS